MCNLFNISSLHPRHDYTHNIFKLNKHCIAPKKELIQWVQQGKNHIPYLGNQFWIFYVFKIKFKNYRLKEKYQKELGRSFNNLLLRTNTGI